MPRLLVMGITGMLGHELWALARKDSRFVAYGTKRSSSRMADEQILPCDLRDRDQVRDVMSRGFDVVINCVGITKRLAVDPAVSIEVNSLAPHYLAAACSTTGARLIHISTDCVFSGRKGNYSEGDIPDPVDLYGRSKLLGEVDYGGHLTIRTSFIGRELGSKHGLLEWFLSQRGDIQGFASVYWSGFTSLALSKILMELAMRPEVAGLLHVGGERIDKWSLLCKLQQVFHRTDLVIHRAEEPRCDRSLDNTRFQSLGIPWPSIDDMLLELATAS